MNYKNVTKTGLNNFIESKVKTQIKGLETQIQQMVDNKIDPIIQSYVDVKKVEIAAQKFADLMEEAIKKYSKQTSGWKFKETISNANYYGTSLGKRIVDEIKVEVNQTVRNPQYKAVDLGHDILNDATKQLQKEAMPLYDKIENLKKLKTELDKVIKNEANGGRGYKALVALGVDMDGYEEVGANLPAITKLSVDVCMINGNC